MGDHTDYNGGFVPARGHRPRRAPSPRRPRPASAVVAHVRSSSPGAVEVAADGSDRARARSSPRGDASSPAWSAALAERGVARRGRRPGDRLDGAGRVRACRRARRSPVALAARARRRRRRSTLDRLDVAQLALDGRGRGHRRARRAHGPARVALRPGRARAADRLPVSSSRRRSPIPPGVAVLVVHCGVPRTLAGSEYASRRAECEAIAARARARRRSATRRPSRSPTRRARVTSSARTRACSRPPPRCRAGDLVGARPAAAREPRQPARRLRGVDSRARRARRAARRVRRGGRAPHRRGLRRVRRRARAAQPRRRRRSPRRRCATAPPPASSRRASSRGPSTARAGST